MNCARHWHPGVLMASHIAWTRTWIYCTIIMDVSCPLHRKQTLINKILFSVLTDFPDITILHQFQAPKGLTISCQNSWCLNIVHVKAGTREFWYAHITDSDSSVKQSNFPVPLEFCPFCSYPLNLLTQEPFAGFMDIEKTSRDTRLHTDYTLV